MNSRRCHNDSIRVALGERYRDGGFDNSIAGNIGETKAPVGARCAIAAGDDPSWQMRLRPV